MRVSAPGKLFLSGEWAILEMGNPGIVAAVNKRVFIEVEEADRISVTIDDFNIKGLGADFDGKELKWERDLSEKESQDTMFIKEAIKTIGQYLGELKPFKMRSWGEESQIKVDGVTKKVGFGSSAASVVATIAGILALHGEDITKREVRDRIYKLSAIAHYFAQGKVGSAFDVAASTYGGVFVYKRFDPDWLLKELESGTGTKEIVGKDWPGFLVEPLEIPDGFNLLIGWTKKSATTSEMVKQMDGFKNKNPGEYKRIYDGIAELVGQVISAWKCGNKEMVTELLRKNEDYLRELGQKSGINIETPELKSLSEAANRAGGAGKLSGAGGGDCGIAICFDKATAQKIKKEWEKIGLYLIDATVDHRGVKSY